MVKFFRFVAMAFLPVLALSQTSISLENLDVFTTKSQNWTIAGNIMADYTKPNDLQKMPGTGILACIHEVGKYGVDYDLFSKFEHADIDLSFDFMMAAGSNSGIYFMERYEVQLMDSWGKLAPKYGDCGGIYERWNDAKPDGQKGYHGVPPRINACKAPGLWQHMEVSFRAPRFDAAGKKISNAIFLKVVLNGQLIHENVEVTGPTRGGNEGPEVQKARLRLQGDHGSLAFKNIQYTNFDKPSGTVSDLKYKVSYGAFATETDYKTIKIDEQGSTQDLTWEVSKKPNDFVVILNGSYNAPTTGIYVFDFSAGGHSLLNIDNKNIQPYAWNPGNVRKAEMELTAGKHNFEIIINKRDAWFNPTLGLFISGPGFRSTPHHSLGSLLASKPTDPILIASKTNTVLRSFMDVPNSHRVTHAVSVGTTSQLHYTYDMDAGALIQVWRGGFLDATPMWNDRGDGSSRPLDTPVFLGIEPTFFKGQLGQKDTLGTSYKPLGYSLDEFDLPTFKYSIFGNTITDKTFPDDGHSLRRDISCPSAELLCKIAKGKVEKLSDTLYAINNKSYYIQINSAQNVKIIDNTTLVASPKNAQISYSILY